MARKASDASLTCFSDLTRRSITKSAKSRELFRVVCIASFASAVFAARSSMRFCSSTAFECCMYQIRPPAATASIATIPMAPSMIILPMVICFLPSGAAGSVSSISATSDSAEVSTGSRSEVSSTSAWTCESVSTGSATVLAPVRFLTTILRRPFMTRRRPPVLTDVDEVEVVSEESSSSEALSPSSALAAALSSITIPAARTLLMSPMHASHVG